MRTAAAARSPARTSDSRLIVDPADPRLHPYRHVGDPSWLRARGLFVAEGRLVVQRLLATRRYDIESVLVTPAANAALESALASCASDVLVCAQGMLNAITGFNFHRGCLALARRPEPRALERTVERLERVLVLEGVGNPDNVGGLFRTGAALGVQAVVLDASTADPLYRKAIRTSMAATLRVPFVVAKDLPDALVTLKRTGFAIVAMTPAPDAVPIGEVVSMGAGRLAVMVGAEGGGLSQAAVAAADLRVRIPIDPAFDSLNVVVAAGIALDRLRG